jgi:O-antigen/teichoic acid export membrane protein
VLASDRDRAATAAGAVAPAATGVREDRRRPATTRLRVSLAASLAGKAAEMVTLVLLATVVPRALGPQDYGRFAVPLTIVTLGSLAMTLGGPTLMARYVPTAPESERVALARALGARLARGRALQLAALAVVAVVAATLDPAHVPPAETALVVAALAVNVATSVALQVTLGLGRAGPWSARFPLQNAVLVAAVLVLHGAYGATGAVVALVVAALAAGALAATAVAPVVTADVAPVAVPDGAIRFGALQATGAALVQGAHRGGVVVVAVLVGSAVETGYAALAIGIALGATYAVLQTFTVALPHLAGAADTAVGRATPPAAPIDGGRPIAARGPDAGPVRAEVVSRRLAGALLAVIAPAALIGGGLADRLVPAVFGEDYAGAAGAFVPALAVVVLAPLSSLLVQATALRLRAEVAVASGVATAAAFLAGALVMVPAWGAAGATGAALAGVAGGTVVSLRMLPGAAGARLVGATCLAAGAVLAVGLA